MFHNTLVKVFSTQVSVTISSHNFKDSIVNCEEGDIKSSTTQVKHEDVLLALSLVQSISNGSSRSVQGTARSENWDWDCHPHLPSRQDMIGYLRLIDDSHHIQPSNSTSIFCSLTLSIIEVGWHSNYSMGNLNN